MDENSKIQALQREVDTLKGQVTSLVNSAILPEAFVQKLVARGFFLFDKDLPFTNSSGKEFPNLFVNAKDSRYILSAQYSDYYRQFTAATSDVITSVSHGLSDGDQIWVLSTGTLPSPLSSAVPLYIINSTTDTFKVSLTSGGVAVNITNIGSGTHYWSNF